MQTNYIKMIYFDFVFTYKNESYSQ